MSTIANTHETCEGGSNGADVTTGNSIATAVSSTKPKFSTAQKVAGTRSILFDTDTGGTAQNCSIDVDMGVAKVIFGEMAYWWFTRYPSANMALYSLKDGSTVNAEVRVMTDGKLQLRDRPSASLIASWNSTASIPLNTWVRIAPLADTDKNELSVNAYALNDATPIAGLSSGAQTLTQNTINKFSLGIVQAAIAKMYMDEHIADDAVRPGPLSTAPTVVIAPVDPLPTTGTAHVDATVTGNNGTTTYAWTRVSGPTVSIASASAVDTNVTNTGGVGDTVLRLTVTDDSGPVVAQVTIPWVALGRAGGVASVITASGWTAVGAATVEDALTDGDPDSYIVSGANPTSLDLEVQMTPVLPPAPGAGATFTLPLRRDGGSSGSGDLSLRNAAGTLVKKKTAVTLPSAGSLTGVEVTFSAADLASGAGLTDDDWQVDGVRLLYEATASA